MQDNINKKITFLFFVLITVLLMSGVFLREARADWCTDGGYTAAEPCPVPGRPADCIGTMSCGAGHASLHCSYQFDFSGPTSSSDPDCCTYGDCLEGNRELCNDGCIREYLKGTETLGGMTYYCVCSEVTCSACPGNGGGDGDGCSSNEMCSVRNLQCPEYALVGSNFDISYQFQGTGCDHPYEARSIWGPVHYPRTCGWFLWWYICSPAHTDHKELWCDDSRDFGTSWHSETHAVSCPSKTGTYTYSAACDDASESDERCGGTSQRYDGDGTQSKASCSVQCVTTLPKRLLTVSKQGTGSGTVTSNPAGISCGGDCSQSYNYGTSITLTASASSDSTFIGWSGDCSGIGTTCTLPMRGAKNVTATFNVKTYSLTVSKQGTGSGTIASNPAGINCGADCQETYNHGASITLTASSPSDSAFTGWSGDCSGTGNCVVAMNSAKNVIAAFTTKVENCCNGADDDGDGAVDCSDSDCTGNYCGLTCDSQCQTYQCNGTTHQWQCSNLAEGAACANGPSACPDKCQLDWAGTNNIPYHGSKTEVLFERSLGDPILYGGANVNLSQATLPDIFGACSSNIDAIWHYDPVSRWRLYYPAFPGFGSLTSMETGKVYFIYLKTGSPSCTWLTNGSAGIGNYCNWSAKYWREPIGCACTGTETCSGRRDEDCDKYVDSSDSDCRTGRLNSCQGATSACAGGECATYDSACGINNDSCCPADCIGAMDNDCSRTPPYKPEVYYPQDELTGSGASWMYPPGSVPVEDPAGSNTGPTLRWKLPSARGSLLDPDGDTVTYYIYFSADRASFGSSIGSVSGTRQLLSALTYDLPNVLDYNRTYFWRVVANDSTYNTRSDTFKFTTEVRPSIGYLKLRTSTETIKLNVITVADAISALKGLIKVVLGDGTIGAADLVETSDPDASPVRVHTPYGTKAWKEVD